MSTPKHSLIFCFNCAIMPGQYADPLILLRRTPMPYSNARVVNYSLKCTGTINMLSLYIRSFIYVISSLIT